MSVQCAPANINLSFQFTPKIYRSNSFQAPDTQANKKKKMIVRMRFSPTEDEELIRLVSLYGDQDWNKISDELTKQSPINVRRTARQCKDRYLNYLSPEITNSEWTVEEDQLLIFNFLQSPSHWKSMKLLLPGRSEVAIKNRFKFLYKEGLSLIKQTIKNNIPKTDETGPSSQDENSNKNLVSNIRRVSPNPHQFVNQINKNLGPVTSNRVKSIVTELFKVPHTQAFYEKKDMSKAHAQNISSLFSGLANDVFQIESDSESFDALNLFDMF